MQQTKFLFSRRAPRMQMSDTSSRLLERRGLRKPPTLIEPSRFPSGRVGRGLIAAALPVLALLALGAPASAQDPEQRIQSLEAQLRDLRTRIQQREFQFDEMERRLSQGNDGVRAGTRHIEKVPVLKDPIPGQGFVLRTVGPVGPGMSRLNR